MGKGEQEGEEREKDNWVSWERGKMTASVDSPASSVEFEAVCHSMFGDGVEQERWAPVTPTGTMNSTARDIGAWTLASLYINLHPSI